MVAGLYLGELFRLAIVDLVDRDMLFKGQDAERLRKPYILNTPFLVNLENDDSFQMHKSREALKSVLNVDALEYELAALRDLAEAISVRGARLCCCGIAAICRKKQITSGHVAADGPVAKSPNFKQRWAEALGEVLDWPRGREKDAIVITAAEDGPGIGAAVISAMAPTWPKQKDRRASFRQSIGGADVFA